MRDVLLTAAVFLVCVGLVQGQPLPDWVESVTTTPLDDTGRGSVTLAGNWLDTCAPDTIDHSISNTTIELFVEHSALNVGCGDAITAWSLTEEFGPLLPATYSIFGTLDTNRARCQIGQTDGEKLGTNRTSTAKSFVR